MYIWLFDTNTSISVVTMPASLSITSILLPLLVVCTCCSCVFGFASSADEYVTEMQQHCHKDGDFFTCGKYKIVRYLERIVVDNGTGVFNTMTSSRSLNGGRMQLVTIEPSTMQKEVLFPAATRQLNEDSQFRKFVKFLQRQMDVFLNRRGLAVPLSDDVRIVDSDEAGQDFMSNSIEESRSKKKKAIIIPLIILFKLFKIKVLMAVVLFGLLFIKKAIIFLFLVAPSYLQMLKMCKVQHTPHHHIEEHDYGPTGYGHHAYAKDWSNARAYAAYKPS